MHTHTNMHMLGLNPIGKVPEIPFAISLVAIGYQSLGFSVFLEGVKHYIDIWAWEYGYGWSRGTNRENVHFQQPPRFGCTKIEPKPH